MPEAKHAGFKGTAKFVGWIIGIVVLIFEFLMNWIGTYSSNGFDPVTVVTPGMIVKVLVIAAICALGIPAMFYIGDMLWAFADKIKETIYQ